MSESQTIKSCIWRTLQIVNKGQKRSPDEWSAIHELAVGLDDWQRQNRAEQLKQCHGPTTEYS